MAELDGKGAEVNARIVYWGIEGAGKLTNLRVIRAKLRPDHRGELRRVPTRLDPSVSYAVMSIELGEVGGVRTRLQVNTVPSGPEHAPSRKQLLDRVDGIVFVVDTTRSRLDENLAAFEEMRSALAAYGRSLEEVPLVIQYNKRDQGDPFALEELHRKLSMRGVAAFEAVAKDGTAVLQTLTTISKRVIRSLRERSERDARAELTTPVAAAPAPLAPPPSAGTGIDPALLAAADDAREDRSTAAHAEALFEPEFRQARSESPPSEVPAPEPPARPAAPGGVTIEAVGRASLAGPRTVRVPLVLDPGNGRRLRVALNIELDVSPEEPNAG
jgi:signal recognition particle receptor subunit beta